MYVPIYDNSELILKDKIDGLHKQWIANIVNNDILRLRMNFENYTSQTDSIPIIQNKG